MKKPGQDADWTSYTIEFTSDAWLIILVTLLVLVIFLHLISKLNPRESISSVSDSAIYVISAFCNMGETLNKLVI